MTGPLQNITQGMNLLISAMHSMQAAAGQNVQLDKTLTTAKQKIAAAEMEIMHAIDQADAAQHAFNRTVHQGKAEAQGIATSIKHMAAAYLSFEAAKGVWHASVGGAMEQQQMIDTFGARAGSQAAGGAIFDAVSKQALQLGQNVDDALAGSMSFMSSTMDPQKLTSLNKLAMRLSKLNPEEGLKGAAFSMKELLSGDYTSIVERFNIGRSQIQSSDALKAGKAGDLDGFIKGMDSLLNQQNLTEQAFEKMLDSPAAKWQKILGTFQFQMKQTGADALTALAPVFDFLGKAFDEGKFDPFFKALDVGLWLVANLINGAAHAAVFFVQVIAEGWPFILGILGALAYLYLPMLTAQLWKMLVPILEQAGAWMLAYWPVLLIGIAVGGLIYLLLKMGVTADQMVGFVTGVFYTLFAFLYNNVAYAWNIFASFAEFLINLFIDPVYAVEKLFYDLAQTFLGHIYTMLRAGESFAGNFMEVVLEGVNGIIKGVNWLIEALNKLPGVDIPTAKLFDTDNVHAMSDGIKKMMDNLEAPTTDKYVVHIARMGEMDLKNSFDKGNQAGKGIIDKVAGALDGFQLPGSGDINTVDRVNSIGSIDDTVDISSEDLKIMRDLAEMKAVQNFVTLTPTVQVTTGPVSKDVDVDELIRQIGDTMDREIAASAQGHYE